MDCAASASSQAMPGSDAICARKSAKRAGSALAKNAPQAIPMATSPMRIMDAVPRTALRKAASLVRITKGEMRRQRTVRVRGSAVQRAKALASDAGGTEGREPGTGARRHALRRQVKGLIENHRSDYRARNSLSGNMAETMTSVSGRLRLSRTWALGVVANIADHELNKDV